MAAFCFLRNVHDMQPCGKTAYELRYGEPFYGPTFAFGASVMYKPSRQRDTDEMPKMRAKMLPGLFMGYVQQSGGGWSGDVDIMDALDLTNAQSVEEVRTERFSANEITIMKKGGVEQKVIDKAVTFDDFIFPVREDEWRQPLDGRKMARRMIKKGELVVDADMCIGNTMPIDPDEVDNAEDETRKLSVIRKKIKSISPAASQK